MTGHRTTCWLAWRIQRVTFTRLNVESRDGTRHFTKTRRSIAVTKETVARIQGITFGPLDPSADEISPTRADIPPTIDRLSTTSDEIGCFADIQDKSTLTSENIATKTPMMAITLP